MENNNENQLDGIGLDEAMQEAEIEKQSPSYSAVHLRGKGKPPKISGIKHEGLSDFQIIEMAVLKYNNRIK